MKARELAELLLKEPELEVVMGKYEPDALAFLDVATVVEEEGRSVPTFLRASEAVGDISDAEKVFWITN